MKIEELSRTIHAYIGVKKYEDALHFFKQNKTAIDVLEIAKNQYLVADMLTALRGIKAYNAGLQFITIYGIDLNSSTSVRVLTSYGWLLYFIIKQQLNEPPSESRNRYIIQTNSRILALLELFKTKKDNVTTSEIVYCNNLTGYFVQQYFHFLKNITTPDWEQIMELCVLTDPELLSDECNHVSVEHNGKSKDTELASTRELWYAWYSKALFEREHYQTCIEICQTALQKITKLHYSNKIWFLRRIAQCYVQLAHPEKAILLYEKIIIQKPEWFLYKELSQCYEQVNKPQRALEIARQAASSQGPINFKVELIEYIGDLVYKQKEVELAWKHYCLAKLIREAEKWHTDRELLYKIKNSITESVKKEYTKDELKKELTLYWNTNSEVKGHPPVKKLYKSNNPVISKNQTGTIVKLLNPKSTGTDGFLKSHEQSVYFFVPMNNADYSKLKVGQKMAFDIMQTEKGAKAINIRFV